MTWKGYGRKKSMTQFEVYPCICLQELRKTMTNPSQENWSLGSYLNPGPPGYEYYQLDYDVRFGQLKKTQIFYYWVFSPSSTQHFDNEILGEGGCLNYVMKYSTYNNNYLVDFIFKMYNMQMYISPGTYVQLTQLQYTQTFHKLKRNKMYTHNFNCYFMRYFVSIHAGCVTCGSP